MAARVQRSGCVAGQRLRGRELLVELVLLSCESSEREGGGGGGRGREIEGMSE